MANNPNDLEMVAIALTKPTVIALANQFFEMIRGHGNIPEALTALFYATSALEYKGELLKADDLEMVMRDVFTVIDAYDVAEKALPH